MTAMVRSGAATRGAALTGEQVLLAPADLLPGDVLLHQPGRRRWYEKGIALATGSPFVHASIYVGNDRIAEARLPGVRVCAIARAQRRERRLCILRQPKGLRGDQVAALRTFVDAALQRNANFDLAFPFTFLGSRLARRVVPIARPTAAHGPLPPANKHKYFCTSFVLDAFRAMGLIDHAEAGHYRLGSLSAADLLADDKFGSVIGFLETERRAFGALR